MAPNKYHLAEALRHWTIYLWCPWQFLGMPFVADPQNGTFYPLNLLFAFLPFTLAHKLFLLLHYPLAAFTMDLFLRGRGLKSRPALLGGLAFAMSGYMISQFGPVRMVLGAAWAPLAFYCLDRALREGLVWAAGCGAVLAMQVIAGDPETALITAALLAPYSVGGAWALKKPGRGILALGLAAVFSLGLAAAQIAPSWEMMRLSTRSGGLPLQDALEYSFHPASLLEIIWPTPFGAQWPEFTLWGRFMVDTKELQLPWCMSYYLGVPVMVLAGIGLLRGRRGFRPWLFIGLALFLLLSLGRYTPVYSWFHRLVPLFSLFRYPAKYMAWFTGFAAVAAALGLEKLEQWLEQKPGAVYRGAAVYLAVMAAGIVAARFFWPWAILQLGGFFPESAAYQMAMAHIRSGWIQWSAAGLAAGLFVLGAARRVLSPAIGITALLALLVFDLWITNVAIMPAGPEHVLDHRSAAAAAISPAGPPPLGQFRIAREEMNFRDTNKSLALEGYSFFERSCIWQWNTLKRNLDGIAGFEDLTAYGSYEMKQGHELYEREIYSSPRTMAVYNMEYMISPSGAGPLKGIENQVIADDPVNDFSVVRLAHAFPRAYWVPCGRQALDEKEAFAMFKSTDHEAFAIITTNEPLLPSGSCSDKMVPAAITRYEPDRVDLEITAPAPGWLVLSDRIYPGWTATVNGEAAPIYTANVMVRAVRVNAGPSSIQFHFRPRSVNTGAVLSLSGLILLIGWIGYSLQPIAARKQ